MKANKSQEQSCQDKHTPKIKERKSKKKIDSVVMGAENETLSLKRYSSSRESLGNKLPIQLLPSCVFSSFTTYLLLLFLFPFLSLSLLSDRFHSLTKDCVSPASYAIFVNKSQKFTTANQVKKERGIQSRVEIQIYSVISNVNAIFFE